MMFIIACRIVVLFAWYGYFDETQLYWPWFLFVRSGESPSSSMDAVNNIPHTIENDSDFEVENELPPLDSIYPRDVYKRLRPKDRKRLEVINGK